MHVILAVTFALLLGAASEARADRVAALSETLLHSKHHKERISAAVSLGRLKDRRSLKALTKALTDEHRSVRALAAVALGRIGDKRALPALRKAAKDPDKGVRKRVGEAIAAIEAAQAPRSRSKYKVSTGTGVPGFGHNPRPVKRPDMYVVLRSAADKSSGRASRSARKKRAAQMKKLLEEELRATPGITTDARVAKKLRIASYNLDASIVRFSRRTRGGYVEIECEIRLSISNHRDKMLSFLTGRATVQVPKRAFKKRYLPRLRLEALENAVKSVHQDLPAQLRRSKGQ